MKGDLPKRVEGGHHTWEVMVREPNLTVYKTSYIHRGRRVTEVVMAHIGDEVNEDDIRNPA